MFQLLEQAAKELLPLIQWDQTTLSKGSRFGDIYSIAKVNLPFSIKYDKFKEFTKFEDKMDEIFGKKVKVNRIKSKKFL